MLAIAGWAAIALGFAGDRLVGDPKMGLHPVALVGRALGALERAARRGAGGGPLLERAAGVAVALIAVGGGFLVSALLVIWAGRMAAGAGLAAQALLVWASIAPRQLAVEAGNVEAALAAGDLDGARRLLGRLVGRDTDDLSETEVSRAVVESVAENLVDGVVAPLFYAALGGGPLAFTYRIVNTLDSMFGYRSSRYRHFGWAAARLDDLVNLAPARLAPLLVAAAASLSRLSSGSALVVAVRHGRRHPSPNSGLAEAAFAGALGVRLGGTSRYAGVDDARPAIGWGLPVARAHVTQAIRLMSRTSWLTAFVAIGTAAVMGR